MSKAAKNGSANGKRKHAAVIAPADIDRMMADVPNPEFNGNGFHGLTPEEITSGRQAMAELEAEMGSAPSVVSRIVATCLSNVKPQAIDWLWPGRIPVGMFSLLCGQPGDGKTWWSCDVAARISTGTPWPDRLDEKNPAGNVLMLNSEDSLPHVIVPRLVHHKADLTRIHAIEGVQEVDHTGKRFFDLNRDLQLLEQTLLEIGGVRLITIDPIEGYLSGKVDNDKSHDVRLALQPITAFAERHNVAIVGVKHLNKREAGNAGERIAGSHAWRAIARSIWFICRDQNDPGRRLFLNNKLNIDLAAPNLAFSIEDNAVHWLADHVEISLDEAMAPQHDGPRRGEKTDEAIEFLRKMLADGTRRKEEIDDFAEQRGISDSAMKRAKKKIGVITKPVWGGNKTVHYYSLPTPDSPGGVNGLNGLNSLDGGLDHQDHLDHQNRRDHESIEGIPV